MTETTNSTEPGLTHEQWTLGQRFARAKTKDEAEHLLVALVASSHPAPEPLDIEALHRLLTEHRPNVVTEGAGNTWQTRVKCDGFDCEFYAAHPGAVQDYTGYFAAVADHTEHLVEKVAEFAAPRATVLAPSRPDDDTKPHPLTGTEAAALRESHKSSFPMGNTHHGTEENPDWGTFCVECKESWPCTTSRLLDTLAGVESERDRYADLLAECPLGLDGHACCDCPTRTEQDLLDQVTAIAADWTCNCGGPSPEGHHEMHCDSYYGDRLRETLRKRSHA